MASDIIIVKTTEIRESHCRHCMGYSYRVAARDLSYVPSHRQDSTCNGLCYTSRGALTGTRNSSMGPPWGIDPTTDRTMSGRSTMELHVDNPYYVINSRTLNLFKSVPSSYFPIVNRVATRMFVNWPIQLASMKHFRALFKTCDNRF